MQIVKILFIILLVLIININKSIGQKIVIDDMYRVQLLIEMGDYDSAIKFAEKLDESLKCEKNEILGFSYWKLSKYDSSIKYYEFYVKECNPSSIQRINLGDSYFKSKQLNKASDQFLKIDSNDPNYSLAQYNLGMIEYERGRKKSACEYFTSALKNIKGEEFDFDYLEMQIKTLSELKEYSTALKNTDKILEIWNKNSIDYKYTQILKSSIFGAKGEYKTAIEILDSTIESGISDEIILLEAYTYQLDFYSKMKNKKQACIIYKKIENIDPGNDILKKYHCK